MNHSDVDLADGSIQDRPPPLFLRGCPALDQYVPTAYQLPMSNSGSLAHRANDRIEQLLRKGMYCGSATTIDPILHLAHVCRSDRHMSRLGIIANRTEISELRRINNLIFAGKSIGETIGRRQAICIDCSGSHAVRSTRRSSINKVTFTCVSCGNCPLSPCFRSKSRIGACHLGCCCPRASI